MPNWKKVIISGSSAQLNHINASGNITASRNLKIAGYISSSGTLSIKSSTAHSKAQITLENEGNSGEFIECINDLGVTVFEINQGTWGNAYFSMFGSGSEPANIHRLTDPSQGGNSWVNYSGGKSSTNYFGIGTKTPTKALTVQGDISASGDLIVNDITASGNLKVAGDISASGDYYAADDIIFTSQFPKIQATFGTANSSIYFANAGIVTIASGSNADNHSFVFDTHNKRLGIDNGAPSEALTVEGNISASGNIYASGDLIVNDITASGNLKVAGDISANRVNVGDNVAGNIDGLAVRGDITASGDLYVDEVFASYAEIDTIDIGSISSTVFTPAPGWNISSGSGTVESFDFVQSSSWAFLAAEHEYAPVALQFNSTGTRLFMIGAWNYQINLFNHISLYEFELTTPYSLGDGSSGTGNDLDFVQSASLEFNGVDWHDSSANGLFFKPGGYNFFLLGSNDSTIVEYSLKTPYSLGNGTTGTGNAIDLIQSASLEFKGGTNNNSAIGFHFKPDGTKVFILSRQQNTLYEYSLSDPWNISSGSGGSLDFVQSSSLAFKAGIGEPFPYDLHFQSNGTRVFIIGKQNKKIYEYSLKEPWTLGDGTTGTGNALDFVQSSSLQFKGGTSEGRNDAFTFKPNGTKMFTVGTDNRSFYEYALTTGFNIEMGSTTEVHGDLIVDGSIKVEGEIFKEKSAFLYDGGVVVDTYFTGSYRTAKYILQVSSGSHYNASEVLLLHSGSRAYLTEYAALDTGVDLIRFRTDVSESYVRLIASSPFESCSIKYDRTLISK